MGNACKKWREPEDEDVQETDGYTKLKVSTANRDWENIVENCEEWRKIV